MIRFFEMFAEFADWHDCSPDSQAGVLVIEVQRVVAHIPFVRDCKFRVNLEEDECVSFDGVRLGDFAAIDIFHFDFWKVSLGNLKEGHEIEECVRAIAYQNDSDGHFSVTVLILIYPLADI